jgi:hypothetical protein
LEGVLEEGDSFVQAADAGPTDADGIIIARVSGIECEGGANGACEDKLDDNYGNGGNPKGPRNDHGGRGSVESEEREEIERKEEG